MAAMASKISELYSLEQLSALDTPIHHIHPLAKLLGTAVYLLCIVSFDRYAFFFLFPLSAASSDHGTVFLRIHF